MSLYSPCPACPDGSVWDANGPTSKICPVCKGHAAVNHDGTPIVESEEEGAKHD